jgi:hypothetical protein
MTLTITLIVFHGLESFARREELSLSMRFILHLEAIRIWWLLLLGLVKKLVS